MAGLCPLSLGRSMPARRRRSPVCTTAALLPRSGLPSPPILTLTPSPQNGRSAVRLLQSEESQTKLSGSPSWLPAPGEAVGGCSARLFPSGGKSHDSQHFKTYVDWAASSAACPRTQTQAGSGMQMQNLINHRQGFLIQDVFTPALQLLSQNQIRPLVGDGANLLYPTGLSTTTGLHAHTACGF